MEETAYQLFLTSRIGDGYCGLHSRSTLEGKANAHITYMGIERDYIQYKHDIISNYYTCNDVKLKDNSAGYNKKGTIYTFNVFSHPDITAIYKMSKIDIINQLDYFGYLMYFFDDGSYHIIRNTMHLYCNSFTPEEVDALKQKVFELFPYKMCRNRIDKKKDGRQYPYLYVPRVTVEAIKEYYTEFMNKTPALNCMRYKLNLPSQTIRNE